MSTTINDVLRLANRRREPPRQISPRPNHRRAACLALSKKSGAAAAIPDARREPLQTKALPWGLARFEAPSKAEGSRLAPEWAGETNAACSACWESDAARFAE